jgi:hypothetical protein
MPGQLQVQIEGSPILCEPDVVGAPIVGCAQPATTSTKPCTVVALVNPGSSSPAIKVGARPVYLETLTGMTDGVPPAPVTVRDPGQHLVQA